MTPSERIGAFLLFGLLATAAWPVTEADRLANDRYSALARIAEMDGKVDEAMANYDKALELDPADAISYNARGGLKLRKKDFTGAVADYDRAIALKPAANIDVVYGNRGFAKHQLDDLDGAIADYSQVIARKPDEALPYNNRGYARLTKGDFDGAIADYTKAITLQPDVIKFRDNLANARRDKGDFAGAISDYDKIVGLEPDLPLHYLSRGNLKQLKDDFDGAIADYNKVIELRPQSWGGYLQRGTAWQAKGDLTAAFTDYDMAVTVTQNDVFFGWAYREIVRRQLRPGTPNSTLAPIVAKWPAGLPKNIGLYLTGTLSEPDFLSQAGQGVAQTVSGRQCVAFYFVGMNRLLAGDKAAARKFFEQSIATKRVDATEFVLARTELARLAKSP